MLVVLLGIHFRLGAGLATVWHIPDNATDLPGINLRNPGFEIGTNTVITFYTGLWKYSGATQLANQTGGSFTRGLPKPCGAAMPSLGSLTLRPTNIGKAPAVPRRLVPMKLSNIISCSRSMARRV